MGSQIFTIPEHDEEFITENISINLVDKAAIVHVGTKPVGAEGAANQIQKRIEVTPLFIANMTGPEITAFKKGINLIVAEAWGKALTDITGDLL